MKDRPFFYSESSQSHFLIEVVLSDLNVRANSIKDQVILAPQIVQRKRIIAVRKKSEFIKSLNSTKSSGKDESVG